VNSNSLLFLFIVEYLDVEVSLVDQLHFILWGGDVRRPPERHSLLSIPECFFNNIQFVCVVSSPSLFPALLVDNLYLCAELVKL